MYLTKSLKLLLKPLLGFFLILFVWIFIGFRPSNIIGLNDISHHLITLLIGNQKYPFFSPIYDWLWMGGQLVAPNVGNIPLERLFLAIGLSPANTLSFTIIFFQFAIFYFSSKILDEENENQITTSISALALAFIPTVSLRIIYGHLSLFIPVLFNLIFYWMLTSQKKSFPSILFSIFIFIHLFSGPYFQIIFYSIILTWPLIIYFHFSQFKKNAFFLSWVFISSLLFNLDYIALIFKYMTSGDLFRDSHSNNLIYSYAKLKLDNFVDLLTYDFINLEDLPFYFAHEIKAYIGILPLLFLVQQKYSFKKYIGLYFLIFVIFIFLFCPPSLEFIFYKIPFLNMFRIPQRVILCFILPVYLVIFKTYFNQKDSNNVLSVFMVCFSIVLGYFSLTFVDFYLIVVALLFIFPNKKLSISLRTFSLVFLISNYFFLFHHPQKTSSKFAFDFPNDLSTMSRDKIYNSNFWTINTNRVLSANSIYGYTHPLPKYRELFMKTFDINIVDLLYFKDLPAHPLNDNFQFLYRYHTDSSLSHSPSILSSDLTFFWKDFKSEKSLIASGEMAFANFDFSSINQKECSKQISISKETINTNNQLVINVFNNFSGDCFIVVPFNFSHFLNLSINDKTSIIHPTNFSQIGLVVPAGKSVVKLYTDDKYFWNLKIVGTVFGLISFFTHYYYRRRYLS